MRSFELVPPGDWHSGDAFIAGGTDLLQLMKSDVVAPERLTDLSDLKLHAIAVVFTWGLWPRWPRLPRLAM